MYCGAHATVTYSTDWAASRRTAPITSQAQHLRDFVTDIMERVMTSLFLINLKCGMVLGEIETVRSALELAELSYI